MGKSYDIPRPFHAIEGEHGTWTVQGYTPNGPTEWVLIECCRDATHASGLADSLNEVVELTTVDV